LDTVTVRPSAAEPSLAGLSDEPAARTPVSTKVITREQWEPYGSRRLSDVLAFDASVSDAYNAIGYWDYVTLRGFVLDQNQNFRRDGMPISAETSIALDNKDHIELLKGTSGIQAGTSAPGGLVNFTVKRPTETDLRTVRLETGSHGGGLVHVDLGGRFGTDRALGYRLNVAREAIRNHVASADGQRSLLALAMDWRMEPDSLLEVELEHSKRRQPSVPGLSLLGDRLPEPNPYTNINSQPWSQPGEMKGLTGSVRYERALARDWRWSIHASDQRLQANDFLAYPYGCYDAATGNYFADRYCPDGNFDLYDFRSLNEERRTRALQIQAKGNAQWGGVSHQVTFGVLRQRQTDTGQAQADNNASVGSGNVYTLPTLPADPTFADPYTLRNDRSTEWFAFDRVQWTPVLSTWMGVRHSQLDRQGVRTDGSRGTAYRQHFTTPWLAAAWQVRPDRLVYASAGQGVESYVAPGRSRYTNAGQALSPLTSRQWEMGMKQHTPTRHMGVALFGITRPRAGDAGSCDAVASCTFRTDGEDVHRGIELNAGQRIGRFSWETGATLLHARRRNGSIQPALNGQQPTNVPPLAVRVFGAYEVAGLPGLSVHARISHEGQRHVVPDGSIKLPSWTTVDAGLAYRTTINQQTATWRLGVNNLLNKRYFKESPYQYSHVYLFPGAPRTWRLSLEAGF
jgi:iron complex outermembrane receptor protein